MSLCPLRVAQYVAAPKAEPLHICSTAQSACKNLANRSHSGQLRSIQTRQLFQATVNCQTCSLCRAHHKKTSQDVCGQNVVRFLQHAKKAGILESCLCIVDCDQTVELRWDPISKDMDDVECTDYDATASDWQTVAGGSVAWNQLEIGSTDTILQVSLAA